MLKNNCCDLFFSDIRKSAMNCLYVTHSFRTSLIRWILINVILYPSGRDKWKLNVSIVMVVMSCIIYRKCGINRIKMCCMTYIRNSSWIFIQLTIANKIRYSWTNSKHISNIDIANNKNVNISFLFFSWRIGRPQWSPYWSSASKGCREGRIWKSAECFARGIPRNEGPTHIRKHDFRLISSTDINVVLLA